MVWISLCLVTFVMYFDFARWNCDYVVDWLLWWCLYCMVGCFVCGLFWIIVLLVLLLSLLEFVWFALIRYLLLLCALWLLFVCFTLMTYVRLTRWNGLLCDVWAFSFKCWLCTLFTCFVVYFVYIFYFAVVFVWLFCSVGFRIDFRVLDLVNCLVFKYVAVVIGLLVLCLVVLICLC